MKARAFAFIAPALLCPLLAFGCGGSDESSTSTATTTGQRTGGEQSIERYGQEAKGSERRELLALYRSYLGALGAKDYAKACELLAERVRKSLIQLAQGKKASCEDVMPAILSPTATPLSKAQAKGEVTRVRTQASQAFVVFKAPGARLWQLTLVREGGRWRAGSLGAAVLVPDL